MKGRFLYIGGFQFPDKNAAAHRVLSIGKILRSLDYDVTYLDVNESESPEYLSCMHYVEGFEAYSMGYPKGTKEWFRFVTQPMHVEKLLGTHNDWRGVIAYNYHAIALWRLRKICKDRKLKLISDITEWYIENIQFSFRYLAVRVDTFLKMRVINKFVDGAIVISDYLKDYYKTIKVVSIPPLVDIGDSKWNKGNELSPDNSKVKLTYAGAPGKHKDRLDIIIDVLSRTSNPCLELRIIGLTKEQYLEMYPYDVNKVKNLIDESRLFFLGIINHKGALECIKKSDFALFYRPLTLSNISGFPTKMVESISCGTPIITNKTKNLEAYWNKKCIGFFFDNEEFKEDLVSFLNSVTHEKCFRVENQLLFDYKNYISDLGCFLDSVLL